MEETDVVRGMPQGSVIGPLLFPLIVDTIGGIHEDDLNILCFPDYTKLSLLIKDVDDTKNMQCIIKDPNTWQKRNNMMFNQGKFQVIQFGRDENLKNEYTYLSPDESELIIPTDNVRDLGVIINSRLDYKEHVDTIFKKAKRRINLMLRLFTLHSLDIMVLSFGVHQREAYSSSSTSS